MVDRLISANAVIERLNSHKALFVDAWKDQEMPITDRCRVDEISSAIAEIVNAPTVKELVTGEWEYVEISESLGGGGLLLKRGYRCNNCGFFRHKRQGKSKFCEDCGCIMKIEESANA